MIRTLTIENFRCFEQFELHDLGRVNLLVGGNNSGKTSVLEAVELLTANGDISALARVQLRRSEEFDDRDRPHRESTRRFLDIRRLFRGHTLEFGNSFSLVADTDAQPFGLKAEVRHVRDEALPRPVGLSDSRDEEAIPTRLVAITWGVTTRNRHLLVVTRKAGISVRTLNTAANADAEQFIRTNCYYLAASSLTPDEAIELYSAVNMRPLLEGLVYEFIQAIAPEVERIGIEYERLRVGTYRGLRSGFSLLLNGMTEPVPIGSMGEGTWRLLALALSLVQAENGILLIDEIDTGLHYSVMEKMWKLVTETAKRLNIQVFATTHSRDCYESLASVCHEDVTTGSEVTIQRIERGKKRSVAYTEREIVIAAEHGMEVR